MFDTSDQPYEGTLSSLSRYGTMNTPSLKTGRERKGKAKVKTPPRYRDQGIDSTVTVYHADSPNDRHKVDPSFYYRTRESGVKSIAQLEAQAALREKQARLARLRAIVAGNEEAL